MSHARELLFSLEPMEDCVLYRTPIFQVLDDYSLEQFRSHVRIPDSLWIHNHNRTAAAHSEARCLASFYAIRAKQQVLALQQVRESRIQFASTTIGRAEIAGADENVVRVTLHLRLR